MNYPDIAASGANPLVHYIQHGRAEGRSGESNDYQSWIERFDTLTETISRYSAPRSTVSRASRSFRS